MEKQRKKVLKKLALSNIKENRIRNMVLTIAIAAVSIMMLTIVGSGISYFKNFTTMNTRLKGTNAQGFINNLTEEQLEKLNHMNEISHIGKQYFLGIVDHAPSGAAIAVSAYDASEWENNIEPTIKDFKGKVPVKKNEILLSEETIKALDIDSSPIGTELLLTIDWNGQKIEQTFLIVGTYKDFVISKARAAGGISGNVLAASLRLQTREIQPTANCVVSEQFAEKYCLPDDLYVTFQITEGENIDQILVEKLDLENTDNIMIVRSDISSNRYLGILLAVAVCVIISLCGYLCIYNIMNIALIKDIHFWGNIKAIGTGTRQLKYIADYQTIYFIIRGVPIGLAIGSVLTWGFVPLILKTAAGSGGYAEIMPVAMNYNIWIFFITALFCYLTVWVSFRRALKFLSVLTPIEALRFNGATFKSGKGGKKSKQNKCGGRLYRMAWHNVYNEKKKFLMVVSTLFMGLFIFLLSYTMFASPNWELYLDKEAPNDFTIIDFTGLKKAVSEEGSISEEAYLNDEVYDKLSSLNGIEYIEKLYMQPVYVKYQEKLLDYAEDESDIFGTAVGIGAETIMEYQLAHQREYVQADLDAYAEGKAVYISAAESGLSPDLEGQEIYLYNKETDRAEGYRIAGILDPDKISEGKNPQDLGATTMNSYLEKEKIRVFMSENGLWRLTDQPFIHKVLINADPDKEPYVKEEIRELIGRQGNIVNRSDLLPTYQPVAASFLIIGTIFSVILLLIGVMNFINSLCTSIYTREKELAVLSSIGMSKRQIIKMLIYEGGYYALITVGLLSTIGLGCIYLFMNVTKQQFYFLEFVPPIPVLIVLLILLCMVCISAPWFVYNSISRRSIVERLKNSDE